MIFKLERDQVESAFARAMYNLPRLSLSQKNKSTQG